MTAIEILVCFSIISVIVIAMFKTVTNYKDKQDIESYKNSITTYKNTVTKEIQYDIIKNKGIYKINSVTDTFEENGTMIINLGFTNGATRVLTIKETINNESDTTKNSYTITYQKQDDTEEYELPKIYGLEFNEPLVKEDDGFIIITVGLTHPDLGNNYNALDMILPTTKAYPKSY